MLDSIQVKRGYLTKLSQREYNKAITYLFRLRYFCYYSMIVKVIESRIMLSKIRFCHYVSTVVIMK